MSTVNMRRARSNDAAALSDLAVRAKQHWGYPDRWIAAWREELTVSAAYVAEHRVYVAELGGELAGFYALRESGAQAELDHFWVDPSQIGRGFGKTMFHHAVAQARDGGANEMTIDSDPYAAGFYTLMGAEPTGAVSAPMDGIARERPQFTMRLDAVSSS